MSKLPVLKPKVVLRAFLRGGFIVVNQTGSHIRLRHPGKPHIRVTIPIHTQFDLPPSVLLSILRQAELTRDTFQKLL